MAESARDELHDHSDEPTRADAEEDATEGRGVLGATGSLLALQQAAGNRAVSRLADGETADPPPADGSPDLIAALVSRAGEPTVRRSSVPDREPPAGKVRLRSDLVQRDWDDWVPESVSNAASAVGSAVSAGADAVGSAVAAGADAVGSAVSAGADAVGSAVSAGVDAVQDVGQQVVDAGFQAAGAVASGAKAVGGAVKDAAVGGVTMATEGAKALGGMAVSAAQGIARGIYNPNFRDLNASQFLVTGDTVEVVQRQTDEQGKPVYFKTGIVTSYESDPPAITWYPEEQIQPMRDGWMPSVTHINGMMVKPHEGIASAVRLKEELDKAGGQAVLERDVPAVLYTYSAHRGFVTDLLDCVAGKVYLDDDATRAQTQLMLDAVHQKKRTTVSAHSRGTIKTDNAVRNAHAALSKEYLDAAEAEAAAEEEAAAASAQLASTGSNISLDFAQEVFKRVLTARGAQQKASEEMNRFIQLVYAGNAVEFPDERLELHMVVATGDLVSMTVGTYSKHFTHAEMTGVSGGHGFDENYAATVAGIITDDLATRE